MEKTRPKSLHKFLKIAAVVLPSVLICILFRKVIADTLTVVFGAAVVAFLLEPAARFFEKRFPRNFSALLALLSVGVLLAFAGWLLFPALVRETNALLKQLPQMLHEMQMRVQSASRWLSAHIGGLPLPSLSLSEAPLPVLASGTLSVAGSVADMFYHLSLMVVLGYFFLCDRSKMMIRMELLIPLSMRRTAVRMGNAVCRELRLYLRGQAMIALAVGSLAAFGLWCIGMPSALALGALVGLLNMIPYFGPVIGGVPAVLMAFGGGWYMVALTVVVLWLVQQCDSALISPRIMGSVLGVSPATVLLAIFIGSSVAGIVGMLIALPVVMCIRTVFRVFVQMHENV